jgi:septal ring factor EnvC (AmiA/AmiB activator)
LEIVAVLALVVSTLTGISAWRSRKDIAQKSEITALEERCDRLQDKIKALEEQINGFQRREREMLHEMIEVRRENAKLNEENDRLRDRITALERADGRRDKE